MNRRTLFWKVYPYTLLIIIASLLLTSWYASSEMRRMYFDELTRTLEERARLVDRQLRPWLIAENYTEIDRECKKLGSLINTRITITDKTGNVLGDTDNDPQQMENHGFRPEIAAASRENFGAATRFSNTLQKNMLYVALPIKSNEKTIGIVRTALPVSEIGGKLNSFYTHVTMGGIIIIILAAVISSLLFRRISGPIRLLQQGAESFARGQFLPRLPISDTEEIGALSASMNKMAEQLDSRIRTIIKERNEREAILASMSEGVMALDEKERVVTLNRAVAEFLNLDIGKASGKAIQEIVRLSDLHDLIAEATKSAGTVEAEISLPGFSERVLQVHGTALKDSNGSRIGILLVFNDISRLKKLESIRRDFIANVSHELKTPITAIAGSAETLLDNCPDNSDDFRRFLKMIARHSERLNNLVEDLLRLARLESEVDSKDISKVRVHLINILQSSIQSCQELSAANNVAISLKCDQELEAEINKLQIEQAMINLINNAVKYSDPERTVTVEAVEDDSEITLAVNDEGCGIESKHLPRIFERFYRVDKARSREAGGTGLGLAIVKHVALAHNGRVSVDSTVGKGSVFRIHLPKK